VIDDLGEPLPLLRPPRRVVSLVPSLTEAVALSGLLVGATDFCSHPPDLSVARVGGTKYPSVDAVIGLKPDLVLANAEENRREDVEALRRAGIAVWVTYPRTVPEALQSLRNMFQALNVEPPAWLSRAGTAWATPATSRLRAVIPVWRRPWVVLGSDTFAGDVLERLGVTNAFGESPERYPRPSLDDIRAAQPELVILPDEPYAFSESDGPEAFAGLPYALISGRHLTWYGPSLAEAPAVLKAQLGFS
jgi:ABC-type Fe3+-hydroxamate transport system substrate-binding protein